MNTHSQSLAPRRSDAHSEGTLTPPVGARDHVQGRADAPVTLVEYGDYQCPYCGMAHPIVKELQRRLGDQLRFVFRNFPLTELHAHALRAAEAAESVATRAGDDAYWRMHDALFEHQAEWVSAHADRRIAEYAKQSGADPSAVEQDLGDGPIQSRVREDFLSGVRSGVNGTPTFFINAVRFDGDWTDVDGFTVSLKHAAKPHSGE